MVLARKEDQWWGSGQGGGKGAGGQEGGWWREGCYSLSFSFFISLSKSIQKRSKDTSYQSFKTLKENPEQTDFFKNKQKVRFIQKETPKGGISKTKFSKKENYCSLFTIPHYCHVEIFKVKIIILGQIKIQTTKRNKKNKKRFTIGHLNIGIQVSFKVFSAKAPTFSLAS